MQKIVVIHQIGQQLKLGNYFQNYNVLNTSSWSSSSTGRTTTLIFRACFWSRHASTSSSYTTSFHCISDSMVYFPRTPVSVLSSVTCIFLTWNLSKYGICSCAIYNEIGKLHEWYEIDIYNQLTYHYRCIGEKVSETVFCWTCAVQAVSSRC